MGRPFSSVIAPFCGVISSFSRSSSMQSPFCPGWSRKAARRRSCNIICRSPLLPFVRRCWRRRAFCWCPEVSSKWKAMFVLVSPDRRRYFVKVSSGFPTSWLDTRADSLRRGHRGGASGADSLGSASSGADVQAACSDRLPHARSNVPSSLSMEMVAKEE